MFQRLFFNYVSGLSYFLIACKIKIKNFFLYSGLKRSIFFSHNRSNVRVLFLFQITFPTAITLIGGVDASVDEGTGLSDSISMQFVRFYCSLSDFNALHRIPIQFFQSSSSDFNAVYPILTQFIGVNQYAFDSFFCIYLLIFNKIIHALFGIYSNVF